MIPLALMEAASCGGGVRRHRYSVQQEIAPKKNKFLKCPNVLKTTPPPTNKPMR